MSIGDEVAKFNAVNPEYEGALDNSWCPGDDPNYRKRNTFAIGPNTGIGSGVKADDGKDRWDLLPYDAVWEIVKVLTHGARKYSGRNWEKGMSYSRVYAALQRHLNAWYQLREENDPEWGINHLAHAGCCLLFLLAFRMRGLTEIQVTDEEGKVSRLVIDDRPTFDERGRIKTAE